jgi:hypothetical protein
MTVEELKEELRNYPDDLEVVFSREMFIPIRKIKRFTTFGGSDIDIVVIEPDTIM